jgi:flagellar secretion chaperone FliS
MATFEAARNKYVSDSVQTMSPGHLIVALYDRILLDLERTLAALAESDMYSAHSALMHAQEIVFELLTSLDVQQWPEGKTLAALYRHIQDLLVEANVVKQPAPVLACRELILPLRDAWREAAGLVPSAGGAS